MLLIPISFFLGLLYGNFIEWFVHKYLFHKLGRKKGSIFSYHVRGHHKTARKNNFIDMTSSYIEDFGMLFLIILHMPLIMLSKAFFIGLFLYAILFKVIHRLQHLNPEFCKKYFKWHWDHHMKSSSHNFGVVAPWFDYIMRTRKKYK